MRKDAKELSGRETIEALRCCGKAGGKCNPCPLYDEIPNVYPVCYNDIKLHAADLLEKEIAKNEKRENRKCVAVFMTRVNDWTPEDFIDDTLKQQLGQAASEVWERETQENRASFPIDGIPPHTVRHKATVYFAVKEGQG